MTTFDALGVPSDLVEVLLSQGITEPFPIQALTIPSALAGRDVCGKARTGSGKTLAFGLPLIACTPQAKPMRPRSLVLVPTRELATQVTEVLGPLAKVRQRRVASVYGGVSMARQQTALHRGVEIVVATPGRLIDLLERGDVSLAAITRLVIDEADRMADMGFLPQVEWLLRRIERRHQTLLFSATLDGDVEHLVRHHLTNPVQYEADPEQVSVDEMLHRFFLVHQLDKVKVCATIARTAGRSLLFVRTRRGADRLVTQLRREGVKAEAIHGGLSQNSRERALAAFMNGRSETLIATDVAARGIHVDGIEVVIHVDPPGDHKDYLHRSGRTARAGRAGVAVTLALWDQVEAVKRIQSRLGIGGPIVEVFSNDPRLEDLSAWDPAAA